MRKKRKRQKKRFSGRLRNPRTRTSTLTLEGLQNVPAKANSIIRENESKVNGENSPHDAAHQCTKVWLDGGAGKKVVCGTLLKIAESAVIEQFNHTIWPIVSLLVLHVGHGLREVLLAVATQLPAS